MKNTRFELLQLINTIDDEDKLLEIKKHIEDEPKSDEEWIHLFLKFIISFYQDIIEKKKNLKLKDEKSIKFDIYHFYQKSRTYTGQFTLNLESSNVNREQEGFYDLKFQHTSWGKYFSIEAKCLDGKTASVNEYIYRKPTRKKREDGGVFRFVNMKYAEDLSFGGMLGFILKGDSEHIINEIKELLKTWKIIDPLNGEYGNSENEDLYLENILEFENSFKSSHKRRRKGSNILLYHIFLDFS